MSLKQWSFWAMKDSSQRRPAEPTSPVSAPPSLPRMSPVSPGSPSTTTCVGGVPSLDLSRLNLPPHVRRALALKYASKKSSDTVSLSAPNFAPNLSTSRHRFVEVKKPEQEKDGASPEHPDNTDKPLLSNVFRARMRQQRSISLDSRPTSGITFLQDTSTSYGRLGVLAPHERFSNTITSAKDAPLFGHSLSSSNLNTFSREPQMIDLSTASYLQSLPLSQTDSAFRSRSTDREHSTAVSQRQGMTVGSIQGFGGGTDKETFVKPVPRLRSTRTTSFESSNIRLDAFPSVLRPIAVTGVSERGSRYVSMESRDRQVTTVPLTVTDTRERESSHFYQFDSEDHQGKGTSRSRGLPCLREDNVGAALDSVSRPTRSVEEKTKERAYSTLKSGARPATFPGDAVKLHQQGHLDLGSGSSSASGTYSESSVSSEQCPIIREAHVLAAGLSQSRSLNVNPATLSGTFNSRNESSNYQLSPTKRKTGDASEPEESPKRKKVSERSRPESEPLTYLPGTEVQELLRLEHEEQRQLKSLHGVQAQMKTTRIKMQSLAMELEHLHAKENNISGDINRTKNRRLQILQGALRGGNITTRVQKTVTLATTSASCTTTSSDGQTSVRTSKKSDDPMIATGCSSVLTDSFSTLINDTTSKHDEMGTNCTEQNNVVIKVEVVDDEENLRSAKLDETVSSANSPRSYSVPQNTEKHDALPLDADTLAVSDIGDNRLFNVVANDNEIPSQDGQATTTPLNKREWVVDHFEKSRKEFFTKIKQHVSTPKKRQQIKRQRKKFSEAKISNSLAMSKERVELVRERMRGWKDTQDEMLEASPAQPEPNTSISSVSETSVSANTAPQGDASEVNHSSASAVVDKDTNLTPSEIPGRDVTKQRTEDIKWFSSALSAEKAASCKPGTKHKTKAPSLGKKVPKSHKKARKKKKSPNPNRKKSGSRPNTPVETISAQPENAREDGKSNPPKKTASPPASRIHIAAVESLRHKLQRKAKVSKSLSTSKPKASSFEGHTGAVCALKVCQGRLYTCSTDKKTRAFDIQTGECVTEYQGHNHAVNCLEISKSDDRLFTGSNDQTVRSYSIKTGACTHKFTFDGRVMGLHIGFGLLFVGLSTGIVTLVDLTTNTCVERLQCHEPRAVSCLATGTEGQRSLLCTGSFDATISIREHKTGLLIRTIKSHTLTVLCIQVVENVIYSGAADCKVLAHNLNTGERLRSYTGHNLSVTSLQVVGRVLVTSCLDKLIRCYDLMSAELLQAYGGHCDMIFSVHMSNGRIYSGARDGKVNSVKLDLRVYHPCKWKDCELNFGIVSHMKDHVKDFHIIQQRNIAACQWADCEHVFSESNDIKDVVKHVLDHVEPANKASG